MQREGGAEKQAQNHDGAGWQTGPERGVNKVSECGEGITNEGKRSTEPLTEAAKGSSMLSTTDRMGSGASGYDACSFLARRRTSPIAVRVDQAMQRSLKGGAKIERKNTAETGYWLTPAFGGIEAAPLVCFQRLTKDE